MIWLSKKNRRDCSSICRTSNGSGGFPRGQPLKTWNDVVKSKKKEGKKEKERERN